MQFVDFIEIFEVGKGFEYITPGTHSLAVFKANGGVVGGVGLNNF